MFQFLAPIVSGIGSLFGAGSAAAGPAMGAAMTGFGGQGMAAASGGLGSLFTGANAAKFLTGAARGLTGATKAAPGTSNSQAFFQGMGKNLIDGSMGQQRSSLSSSPPLQARIPESGVSTLSQSPTYPKDTPSYDQSIYGIGPLSYIQPTMGYADGGLTETSLTGTQAGTDQNIRLEAIMALRGQHPQPEEALMRFSRRYGPQATQMLIDEFSEGNLPNPNGASMMASGGRPPSDEAGMIRGAGGGVDDLIGGKIEGRQDVYLSDGEFVVPARVVSALGDGSSEQGARVLHEMVDRVKQQGAERMQDNGRLSKEEILPA